MDVDILTPDNSQPATDNNTQPSVLETDKARPNKSKRTTANSWEELEEGEPGYAWSNPKARAEYERAMEMIQDRDFSLKEFGDPLLEEINAEKGQGKARG